MSNDQFLAIATALAMSSATKKPSAVREERLTQNSFLTNLFNLRGLKQLSYFEKNNAVLVFDNDYWNVLGTIWKDSGSLEIQSKFVELCNNTKRRNHKRIMKTNERRVFNKLPKTVTAYRACNDTSEIETSINWSLDLDFVKKYADATGRTIIANKEFDKSEIFAYFNRRKESEILVRIKNAK